jgi:hypothetical protein
VPDDEGAGMKTSWRKWVQAVKRINGIGSPVFSISWNPAVDDRTAAERCITDLEARGLLYADFDWELPAECYAESAKLRDELTRQMQELSRDAPAFRELDGMRDACREFRQVLRERGFQTIANRHDFRDELQKAEYLQALGALRHTCGRHAMSLAVAYGIDVAKHLADRFPKLDVAGDDDAA